jgi:hypothetical protein
MIPLGGELIPAGAAELADALRAGLRQLFALPDERAAVAVEGDRYPAADRLRIDLSGATVAPRGRPPEPVGEEPSQPGPGFRRLEVVAHPLRYQAAALDLHLTAADARFQFDRDRTGRPWLTLTAARDGHFEAKALKSDIEELVQTGVRELARQKGVEVERIEFRLTSAGPRSLRLDAKVSVAKKVLVKTVRGAVSVSGRLDIDDALVAKLSELSCEGEGVVVSLIVALFRDRVMALEGKEYPLAALSLGAVRLRDVQLRVNDELRVTAAFGE